MYIIYNKINNYSIILNLSKQNNKFVDIYLKKDIKQIIKLQIITDTYYT